MWVSGEGIEVDEVGDGDADVQNATMRQISGCLLGNIT